MKTIKIWADTHSTGVFDSIGRFYDKSETTISDKTWTALQQWVEDYDDIIMMNTWEREKYSDKILELDRRGVNLMELIKGEWTKDLKTNEDLSFTYYSEGELREMGTEIL